MDNKPPRELAMLSHFERIELPYKSLNGTNFPAAILIPKSAASSGIKTDCPLLVHFHGGSLLMGTILDPEIISIWPLELAEARNAIVVSPAYRLMPEAKGIEILDDIKDIWAWVRKTLPSEIAARWSHLTLDVDNAAVFGESAGGYLSLQSAFMCPEANIKLVMPQYPAMFPDVYHYPQGFPPSSAEINAKVDTYLKEMKPGAMRLLSPYWGFMPVVQAIYMSRRVGEFMGDDERMTLEYGLRNVKHLPPIWVAQGTEDMLIPRAATDEMVKRIQKAHPEVPLLYNVQPGPHGFESEHTLEEPWIAEAMNFVNKYWP